MPSPSGGNQVQMPWNSGTTAIDPNIVSDFKKVDGWEMVWNSFSPTTPLTIQVILTFLLCIINIVVYLSYRHSNRQLYYLNG